jgi:ectoine hydroxylase-related dioxygenase (phytanoyl-CoA dioxygenase family)
MSVQESASKHVIPRAASMAEAKRQLTEHGLTVIRWGLAREEIARVKAALAHGIENDRAKGVPLHGFSFDPDEKNTRVFDLIGKDQIFRDLVSLETVMELVHFLIGQDVLLSNFSANITAPGSGAMGMHADQGYVPPPWPPYPLAINVAWALDDFTVENGATRFVPGSHKKDHGPEWGRTYAEAVPIECEAGSMFIMDARVWHQTGANTSKDKTRTGLFAYYIRGFLRPQWNWDRTLRPDVLESASPVLRSLLGFGKNPTSDLQSLYLHEK